MEWSLSPILSLLVENQIWMLCLLMHLQDLFMSHSWMLYVLYLCEQTHMKKKKNQFYYLDRCVFVSIWENIHPGWYKYSATLLKTSVWHCKTYNYNISNDLYMCLPSYYLHTVKQKQVDIGNLCNIGLEAIYFKCILLGSPTIILLTVAIYRDIIQRNSIHSLYPTTLNTHTYPFEKNQRTLFYSNKGSYSHLKSL